MFAQTGTLPAGGGCPIGRCQAQRESSDALPDILIHRLAGSPRRERLVFRKPAGAGGWLDLGVQIVALLWIKHRLSPEGPELVDAAGWRRAVAQYGLPGGIGRRLLQQRLVRCRVTASLQW